MKGKYENLKAIIRNRDYKNDYAVFVTAGLICSNFTCFRNKAEFDLFKSFMGGCKLINNRWDQIVYKFNKNININYFYNIEELENGLSKVAMLENGSRVVCFFKDDGNTIHIWKPNPNSLFYKTHILDYFKVKSYETDPTKFVFDFKNIASDIRNYDALQGIIKNI